MLTPDTTTTTACLTRLAVNARLYHLSAGAVTAVTSVNVVKLPTGNKGD